MLIRPHDEGGPAEWRSLLAEVDFGQLVVAGPAGSLPVVLPTHFAFEVDSDPDGHRHGRVVLHVARENPVVPALAASRRALLSVIGPYCFVPAGWGPPVGGVWPVPTSYYATVQLEGTVDLVAEPAAVAGLLGVQLRRFEPDHPALDLDDPVVLARLGRIVGVVLAVEEVRAKFKFGGNKPPEARAVIAEHLLDRAGPGDLEARRHLLARDRREGS